jgi:hypothetical protein
MASHEKLAPTRDNRTKPEILRKVGEYMAFSRRLETQTVQKMIIIYCNKMHGTEKNELCCDCSDLLDYAKQRIDKCFYGDQKPVCSKCKVHCYKPEMRNQIKEVMRYSGPRMLWKSPVLSLRYLYRKRFKSNKEPA